MGTLMAVLQHHENLDGSGYPLGLVDKKSQSMQNYFYC